MKKKKEGKEKKEKKEKKEGKKRKAGEEGADVATPAGEAGDKKAKKAKKGKDEAGSGSDGEEGGSAEAAAAAAPANPLALDNFALSAPVKSLLRAKGIEALFDIQASCLPAVLEGKDLVGRARTGCGKTLAFVLPIVERVCALTGGEGGGARRPYGRAPSVVVLAPTRELAKQVGRGVGAGLFCLIWTVCVTGEAAQPAASQGAPHKRRHSGLPLLPSHLACPAPLTPSRWPTTLSTTPRPSI